MHHILVAHGKAVSVMRDMNLQHLGIVLNFEYPQPANDSKEALEAAKRYDGIYNRWFLGGLFNKQYPEDIAQYLEPYLPRGYQNDFNIIAQPLDWLGINYYTRCIIDADPTSAFPALKTVEGPLPKTAMNWEIFPEGLYSFLDRIHKDYTKDLPLYITENGLALSDKIIDNKVSDIGRIDFLDSHLQYVQQAIMDGIPIMGYFAWSLLDNYEWAFGYEKRFGIIHVDFKTHMRTPKESYYALQKMLEK
jgi:beta-glucosidase